MDIELRQIKREVIDRVLEEYKIQLEQKYAEQRITIEQKYSAYNATNHSFSEEEVNGKRERYIEYEIRKLKKRYINTLIENAIKNCFGLQDETWNWKGFPDEEIVEFLFLMVSLHFMDDRIIYYDKLDTDRRSKNKYIFRDLKKCSLNIDFTNYCTYILKKSRNFVPCNEEMINLMLDAEAHSLCLDIDNQKNEPYIMRVIEGVYRYYLLPSANGKNVLELYGAISLCEEIIGSMFMRYYSCNASEIIYSTVKGFLSAIARVIAEIDISQMSKQLKYDTGYDIFQDYVWRLMDQTTKKEYAVRSDIFINLKENLKKDPADTFVLEEEKCTKIVELMKWYMQNNYSVYSYKELNTAYSKELYYEIYIDKDKYKGMTPEVITNKILRNEYYRGYNLSEEILFLMYKIRRGILRSRNIDYKMYFDLRDTFNKVLELIWDISREDNYNPAILFNLCGRIVAEWERFKK